MPRPRVSQRLRRDRARRVASGHRRARHPRAAARASGGRAGRHHLGARQHRVGGARHQDGRVRLRREAVVAGQDGARRSQRHQAAAPGGREPGPACARGQAPHDGGRELRHAAAARTGRHGRAHQRPRPHLRGERHRQGARGAVDPCDEPPAGRTVRRGQLRGDSRRSDRIGALWSHAGCVHGRRCGSAGEVRSGGRRHDLSRRDRRHEPEDPGQGAARAAGAGGRARREHAADPRRRAGARRHQQGAPRRHPGRRVPGGFCTSG